MESREERVALRRRDRRVAVAASVVVHIAIFIVVFGQASGEVIAASSDGADDVGISVTLVRPPRATSAAPAETGGLTPLFARLGSDQPPVFLPPEKPRPDALSQLLQRVQQTQPKAPPAAQQRAVPETQPSDVPDDRPAQTPRAGAQGATAAGAKPGSTGGFLGAIAPCWRAVGRDVPIPVTLEVSLGADGRLSAPPKILRPARRTLDEPRLKAEAQALAALENCMPRGDVRFVGGTYKLNFGAEP